MKKITRAHLLGLVIFLIVALMAAMSACDFQKVNEYLYGGGEEEKPPENTDEECDHRFLFSTSISPTCSVEGYDVYVCSKCGQEEIRDRRYGDHLFRDNVCVYCGVSAPPLYSYAEGGVCSDLSDCDHLRFCDCDVLTGMLLSGDGVPTSKHTNARMSNDRIEAFDNVVQSFGLLMKNVDTDNSSPRAVGESDKAIGDFREFFQAAKSLFDASNTAVTSCPGYDFTSGAVIGIDRPFSVYFGAVRSRNDSLAALAGLFGYDDVDLFTTNFQSLATYLSDNPPSSVLAVDGVVYIRNSYSIMPFAFRSGRTAVLVLIMMSPEGETTVWVNNIAAAVSLTAARKSGAELDAYGRCILFEESKSNLVANVYYASGVSAYTDDENKEYQILFSGSGSFPFASWTYFTPVVRNVRVDGTNISLPDDSFRNAPELEDVTVAGSLSSVGKRAFMNCTGLRKVTVPDGIEKIGDRAFSGCEQLEEVIIATSLVSMGSYVFENCPMIRILSMPFVGSDLLETGVCSDKTVRVSADGTVRIVSDDCNVFGTVLTNGGETTDLVASKAWSMEKETTSLFDSLSVSYKDLTSLFSFSADKTEQPALLDSCSQKYAASIPSIDFIVNQCDCCVFQSLLRKEGSTSGLSKHTGGNLVAGASARFQSLAQAYTGLVSNFTLSGTATKWYLAQDTSEYASYIAFDQSATALFGASLFSASSVSFSEEKSAVIGINKPFIIALGNDDGRAYADYQTAIARLFGYDNRTLFEEYAKKLANSYLDKIAALTDVPALNFDGAVYTQSGSLIFPYLFDFGSTSFCAYVVLDAFGNMAMWVSDLSAVLKVTKVSSSSSAVRGQTYGRCELFEKEDAKKTAYRSFLATAATAFGGASSVASGADFGYTKGILLGLNRSYTVTFGNETAPKYADCIKAFGKLLGYDDTALFTRYINTLVTFYHLNAAGASNVSSVDKLKYTGAFYTTSETFIFPYVFHTGGKVVAVCIFVDKEGVMSAWIGDKSVLTNVLKATASSPSSVEIFGRCELYPGAKNPFFGSIFTPGTKDDYSQVYNGQYYILPGNLENVSLTGGGDVPSYAFSGIRSSIEILTLSPRIEAIRSYAFYNNGGLEKIVWEDIESSEMSVIETGAFSGCTALTAFILPSKVSVIEELAFARCQAMASFEFVEGNLLTEIKQSAFLNSDALENIVLPSGVTKIGAEAFKGCSALASVRLGENLAYIGKNAFYGCSSLKNVYLLSAAIASATNESLLLTLEPDLWVEKSVTVPEMSYIAGKYECLLSQVETTIDGYVYYCWTPKK